MVMPHKTVIPNKGHSLYILNSTAKIVTKEMMNFCLNLLQVSHKGENSFAGLIDSEQHTKTQSDIISLYTHMLFPTYLRKRSNTLNASPFPECSL